MRHHWTDARQRREAWRLALGWSSALVLCGWFAVAIVALNDGGGLATSAARDLLGQMWFQKRWMPILSEFVVASAVFLIGTCLGSFLNVAAYRLPRGETLFGNSRCPYCQRRIAIRDNIPVWGWIFRGGRCRTCWLPISVEYPRMELRVGVVLMLLAIVEVACTSINLSGTFRPGELGFSLNLFEIRPCLLARFILHSVLLLTLFVAARIEAQGLSVPWWTWLVCLFVLVGAISVDRGVLWVQWKFPVHRIDVPTLSLGSTIWQLWLGGVVGFLWHIFLGRALSEMEYGPSILLAGVCLGMVLGWLPAEMVLVLGAAVTDWRQSRESTKAIADTLFHDLLVSSIFVLFTWGFVAQYLIGIKP